MTDVSSKFYIDSFQLHSFMVLYTALVTLLQYSCLENPMDAGAWQAVVHGVAKSQTWLSDFTFTFHLHALEKEMATHSSILVWRIPGMGKPGGLMCMGLQSRTRLKWLSSSSHIARFLCDSLLENSEAEIRAEKGEGQGSRGAKDRVLFPFESSVPHTESGRSKELCILDIWSK